MGYTPYYTAGVWGGYDDNKSMEGMNASWRETLWKNIMDRVHEDLENKEFDIPSSVVRKTVCTQTGLLAVSGCPSITEYFDEDTVPTESCSGHGYTPPADSDEDNDSENMNDNSNSQQPSDSNQQPSDNQPSDNQPF